MCKNENNNGTVLFTGTFDPFTIGHERMVERLSRLFDSVTIGVAVSKEKHTRDDVDIRVAAIRRLYEGYDNVRVVAYDDLTVDLARRVKARCIVKGVRSVRDFEYEREQADINRRLTGVETLLLPSEPEMSHVSSTMVRTLQSFGRDVAQFLPDNKKQASQ